MDPFLTGIFIAILVVVMIIHFALKNVALMQKKQKEMVNFFSRINNFSVTNNIVGIDGEAGIAFDESGKKVCLLRYDQGTFSNRIFSYKDLLASEIFEDGITLTKTVRSSQFGGALIGSLVFGPIGAIVGGLSGASKSIGKVKRVDLRLTVNDTQNPLHDINFLNLEVDHNHVLYLQAMQNARHWHGLIEVLIKRADQEDKDTMLENKNIPNTSVADELKKLSDLRDSGVLSNEEFTKQKEKLLL